MATPHQFGLTSLVSYGAAVCDATNLVCTKISIKRLVRAFAILCRLARDPRVQKWVSFPTNLIMFVCFSYF